MKKILGAIALLALGSSAEAATINATCVPEPGAYLGQSGANLPEVCSFAAVPVGDTITGITAQYTFDFQFDPFGTDTQTVQFSFNSPGASADWLNQLATVPTRPVTSGVFNIVAGEWALYTGPSFIVLDSTRFIA